MLSWVFEDIVSRVLVDPGEEGDLGQRHGGETCYAWAAAVCGSHLCAETVWGQVAAMQVGWSPEDLEGPVMRVLARQTDGLDLSLAARTLWAQDWGLR